MRKSVLVSMVLIFGAASAAAAGWPDIELVELHSGFDDPVHLSHAGDGERNAIRWWLASHCMSCIHRNWSMRRRSLCWPSIATIHAWSRLRNR